ncbi:MAG: mitochondrial fission ELM1 family protein [Akkermansia sp.]|nr:mitochondrial fission ELM1 family protein [Akkermansia sp.]
MIIWIVSDGKRGHTSQTFGLAEALLAEAGRRSPGENGAFHVVSVEGMSCAAKFFYLGRDLDLPRPDLILGAGHGVHIPMLHMAHRFNALCMVCMKPSLPAAFFDLCLVPRHDLPENTGITPHIFPTIGAINGIKCDPGREKRHTLILIGGPSKEYEWDSEMIVTQLDDIARHTATPMVLTTSRRTPQDFISELAKTCPSIRIVPLEQTDSSWVSRHLASAREIWVSQDSVSMVYESLASGAPVGILDMQPRPEKPSRVARGLQMLLHEERVTLYRTWASTHRLVRQKEPLFEAERAAGYILDRYPQLLTPAQAPAP